MIDGWIDRHTISFSDFSPTTCSRTSSAFFCTCPHLSYPPHLLQLLLVQSPTVPNPPQALLSTYLHWLLTVCLALIPDLSPQGGCLSIYIPHSLCLNFLKEKKRP